jgi:hypothetical protein
MVSAAWASLGNPPGQLGSDLVLLAIHPRTGRIRAQSQLAFGLMAAELVDLAALGRLRIENGRVVLTESPAAATGNEDLDAALASIAAARRPPKPATWVGKPRRHIIDSYLARMSATGIVTRSPDRRARWQVLDLAATAAAMSKLDAVASGRGPLDPAQAALGGLAHATGLDRAIYPGLANRHVRKHMRQIAKGQWTPAVVDAADDADQAAQAASQAVVNAAIQAAVKAAMQAAASAAAAAAASG